MKERSSFSRQEGGRRIGNWVRFSPVFQRRSWCVLNELAGAEKLQDQLADPQTQTEPSNKWEVKAGSPPHSWSLPPPFWNHQSLTVLPCTSDSILERFQMCRWRLCRVSAVTATDKSRRWWDALSKMSQSKELAWVRWGTGGSSDVFSAFFHHSCVAPTHPSRVLCGIQACRAEIWDLCDWVAGLFPTVLAQNTRSSTLRPATLIHHVSGWWRAAQMPWHFSTRARTVSIIHDLKSWSQTGSPWLELFGWSFRKCFQAAHAALENIPGIAEAVVCRHEWWRGFDWKEQGGRIRPWTGKFSIRESWRCKVSQQLTFIH